MSTTPSAPRSANYGTGQLLGASVALVLLIAALVGLGTVVREANADAVADTVVPGTISVVGAAKVRTWEGTTTRDGVTLDQYSLQVPAGWRSLIAGKFDFTNARSRNVQDNRWEGNQDGPPSQDCDDAYPCVELRIEEPTGATPGVVKSAGGKSEWTVRNYAKAVVKAARDVSGGADRRAIDLGPVTVAGGLWAWRAQQLVGDREVTSYFFATCQGGKIAELWEVELSAPRTAVPQAEFDALMASINPSLPTEPGLDPSAGKNAKPRDCGDTVDGD